MQQNILTNTMTSTEAWETYIKYLKAVGAWPETNSNGDSPCAAVARRVSKKAKEILVAYDSDENVETV